MRLIGMVLVAGAFAVSASAQNASIQATPLPPLQQQWLREGSPPVQQAPVGPGADGSSDQTPPLQPGQPQSGPSSAEAGPPTTPDWPNVWLPAAAAKIQALNKIDAQSSDLTIKVGQSATFGSLTITVKSCMVRPTDQPADATAFLDVTDSHPDTAPFDGWLLQAEPSVSMMQNPLYDLRVTGCV